MRDLKRKTNNIFLRILGVGSFFSVLLIALATVLYSRWSLIVSSLNSQLESLCGCANHFSFTNHPWLSSLLLVAGLGVAIFFGFAIYRVFRLHKMTHKFIKANLNNRTDKLSDKLEKIVTSLKLEGKIVEINSSNPTVFCYGLINPKICVSSSFIKKLSSKELTAVLLHEQYHLITHEVIRLFIIKTITSTLFFIPGLKVLSKQYFKLSEVLADKWSIDNSQDKAPLAGAIYKILELRERMILENGLAVAYFNQITEERIKRIEDDNYNLNIKIVKPRLVLSLLFLSGIMIFIFSFIYSSKSAIAGYDEILCSSNRSTIHTECQMLYNESACEMYQRDSLPKDTSCDEISYSSIE